MQKISRQQYCLLISRGNLILRKEVRWTKRYFIFSLPKETVTSILIVYRIMKIKITHLMETQTSSILALEISLEIHLLNLLWTSIELIKENAFTAKKKSQKQTIFCRKYNIRRLRWWFNTSCKFISPSRISTA